MEVILLMVKRCTCVDRRTVIGGIVIAFVILIPVLWVIDPLGGNASELYWAVEIGDEFEYSVFHMSSTSEHGVANISYLQLNRSLVVFEITSLPEIPLVMDETTYIDSIIDQIKCEVRFENGSDIPAEFRNDCILLFSHYLLPVGDWDYTDSLFDYDPSYNIGETVYDYLGYQGDGVFIIGHIGSEHHGSEGWKGNVNMTSGVPSYFIYSSGYMWGDGTSTSFRLSFSSTM